MDTTRRRNAIIWKDFYLENDFCDHITLDNGEKEPRFMHLHTENDKPLFTWLCSECNEFKNNGIGPIKLENNDKGKTIDHIDI